MYPCYILLVVTMIGSWIYVKWTRTAPTWLIAFWTNSMSVLTLVNMLNTPNSPWGFSLIAIIMVVLVCKVPNVNLTVPVMALLVFGYNFSLGRTGKLPLMVLPDGGDVPHGDLVSAYVQGIAALLMALYGVYLKPRSSRGHPSPLQPAMKCPSRFRTS